MSREITVKDFLDAVDGCGWDWDWKQRQMARAHHCRKRLLQKLDRKQLNSTILKQNAQLRKDGYTGPFLGACLLTPPPKN